MSIVGVNRLHGWRLGRGTNRLLLHLLGVAHDFIWRTLDDATCTRKLCGAAHEIRVDIACGLTAFVDSPVASLVRNYSSGLEGGLTKRSKTGPYDNRPPQTRRRGWCCNDREVS